jgi:hypothetical protein
MKVAVLSLGLLIALGSVARAITPFDEALATFDTKPLQQVRLEGPERIHKDLVLQTIAIADRLQVRIHPEASIELDKIYIEASMTVAAEESNSERLRIFPANRVRFIGRLISLAESRPRSNLTTQEPIAMITPSTIQALQKELQSQLSVFCPCWPFCK